MISPELLRRYPFFAGLEESQIVSLAQVANEEQVDEGHYFFHEDDKLDTFYLVVEGEVAVIIEVPDQTVEQKVSGQLMGELQTKDIVISTVGPGEVFAWSGLVPPHEATGAAKANSACRVVAFDGVQLRQKFEEDCQFGYVMMQKAAQVSRGRLRDLRIESLASLIG
jgi:CRP-like cAMP-binding protein